MNTDVSIAATKILKSYSTTLLPLTDNEYVTQNYLDWFKWNVNIFWLDPAHFSRNSVMPGPYMSWIWAGSSMYGIAFLSNSQEWMLYLSSNLFVTPYNVYFHYKTEQNFTSYINIIAGIHYQYSDIRLKKNINEVICKQNEIYEMYELIKIKTFNYIFNDIKRYGIIAQDVIWNTILRECLTSIDNDTYTVYYARINLINVLGIQQLIKDDDKLQIKINEVETLTYDLKARIKKITDFLNIV